MSSINSTVISFQEDIKSGSRVGPLAFSGLSDRELSPHFAGPELVGENPVFFFFGQINGCNRRMTKIG